MGLSMVDYFSLAVTHGLMALAVFRLMLRADLDRDPPAPEASEPAAHDDKGKRSA